jgi:uncharacterized SAM-binding protein YcdF (DUF218 family)
VTAPGSAVRRPRWIRVALGLSAAALIAWVLLIAAVVLVGRVDDRRRADAIVVLGAAQYAGRPSPVLQARLDHAAALWRDSRAPLLLVTGGVGKGDRFSEADVGRRYLLGMGIPDSAILLEREGRTTGQSVRSSAEILRRRNLRVAILVSDPFHALRLRILAMRHGLRARTSPTRTSPIARNALREWRYVLGESVKFPVAALWPNQ